MIFARFAWGGFPTELFSVCGDKILQLWRAFGQIKWAVICPDNFIWNSLIRLGLGGVIHFNLGMRLPWKDIIKPNHLITCPKTTRKHQVLGTDSQAAQIKTESPGEWGCWAMLSSQLPAIPRKVKQYLADRTRTLLLLAQVKRPKRTAASNTCVRNKKSSSLRVLKSVEDVGMPSMRKTPRKPNIVSDSSRPKTSAIDFWHFMFLLQGPSLFYVYTFNDIHSPSPHPRYTKPMMEMTTATARTTPRSSRVRRIHVCRRRWIHWMSNDDASYRFMSRLLGSKDRCQSLSIHIPYLLMHQQKNTSNKICFLHVSGCI